jgi:histidine ammonia-lyase
MSDVRDRAFENTNAATAATLHPILIGANRKLTLSDVNLMTVKTQSVKLSDESYPAMDESYQFLRDCVDQSMPVYGLNTNFGDQVSFVDVENKNSAATTSYESITYRQENIVRSMACSLGTPVASDVIKVAMMLRSHCLSQGYSGVSPMLVETILDVINAGITPVVRCYGSIGASGDLIPLASIAAALIGEDVDVMYEGKIMRAPLAFELAGLKKLNLQMRDGLAMINGTSFMTAIASLSLYQLKRLFKQMLGAIAMSLEAMLVISSAYHPLVHQLKCHLSEMFINDFMVDFWQGSALLSDLDELRQGASVKTNKTVKPVQDYYSLRAVAQGFGTFHENLERATIWIENEMNSVNDNPIIDAKNTEIHHGANFMGYYVTDACDILKMNISQASTWIHALFANLVHPRKNHNLPVNLVEDPGKHNGFRSLQILTAALAVQNRKLAQSQQAFMLPTEGDNQDVNSLGTHAALDFQEAVANLERVTAMLLMASTQALEFRGIEKAGTKAQTVAKLVRSYSPKIADCRPMTEEISGMINLMRQEDHWNFLM